MQLHISLLVVILVLLIILFFYFIYHFLDVCELTLSFFYADEVGYLLVWLFSRPEFLFIIGVDQHIYLIAYIIVLFSLIPKGSNIRIVFGSIQQREHVIFVHLFFQSHVFHLNLILQPMIK
jgi:hypothetical protein